MVHIRLVGLVLGLFFVLNALRNSYAHAHSDWEMNENELKMTGGNVVSDQMEIDGASTRKMGLGGRKLIVRKVVMREEIEKVEGLHEGASEDISGAKYSDVECDFGVKKDFNVKYEVGDKSNSSPNKPKEGGFVAFSDDYQKNNVDNLTANTKKPSSLGIPISKSFQLPNINPKHSHQDSKPLPTKASLESPSEGERQRVLEATREIANLMHKDYKGMGKPRRKPPINNHVPVH